jgi:hypothetical protein
MRAGLGQQTDPRGERGNDRSGRPTLPLALALVLTGRSSAAESMSLISSSSSPLEPSSSSRSSGRLAGELDLLRGGDQALPFLSAPSSDSPSDDSALTADRLRLLATFMGASSSSSDEADGAEVSAPDVGLPADVDGSGAELAGPGTGGEDARAFLAGDGRAFGSSSPTSVKHRCVRQPACHETETLQRTATTDLKPQRSWRTRRSGHHRQPSRWLPAQLQRRWRGMSISRGPDAGERQPGSSRDAPFSVAGSGSVAFLPQRPASVGCSFLGGGTPLMCLKSVVCLGSAATLGFLAGGIVEKRYVRRLKVLTSGWARGRGRDGNRGRRRIDRGRGKQQVVGSDGARARTRVGRVGGREMSSATSRAYDHESRCHTRQRADKVRLHNGPAAEGRGAEGKEDSGVE